MNKFISKQIKRFRTNLSKGGIKSKYDINEFPLRKKDSDLKFVFYYVKIGNIFWKVKFEGLDILPNDESLIICPNHESYFDSMWTAIALNTYGFNIDNFCSLAAEHLLSQRWTRKAFIALGGIPINRNGNTLSAIKRVIKCLKLEKRCFMLIHPEGTRSRTGKLGEFKQGAAKISIKTGVKIIPVCINGAYEIYPPHRKLPRLFDWKHFRKYPLNIQFGTPIAPNDKTAEEITNEIRHQIVIMKNEWNYKK